MTARPEAPHVGLIVEGKGDHEALPVLLRRHLNDAGIYDDVLGEPIPVHGRGNATADGGIEGFAAVALARPGCVGLLVVLDGDGDCVARLGPSLLERARTQSGKPIHVALADVDFEDWIYASAETLDLGLAAYDASVRGQTAITNALKPRKYVKPTWQPRLAARVDLGLSLSRSASLGRMLARFDDLAARLP